MSISQLYMLSNEASSDSDSLTCQDTVALWSFHPTAICINTVNLFFFLPVIEMPISISLPFAQNPCMIHFLYNCPPLISHTLCQSCCGQVSRVVCVGVAGFHARRRLQSSHDCESKGFFLRLCQFTFSSLRLWHLGCISFATLLSTAYTDSLLKQHQNWNGTSQVAQLKCRHFKSHRRPSGWPTKPVGISLGRWWGQLKTS